MAYHEPSPHGSTRKGIEKPTLAYTGSERMAPFVAPSCIEDIGD